MRNEKGSVSFGIFEQVISMKTRQGKNQMTLTPYSAGPLILVNVRKVVASDSKQPSLKE
jgi:hypothetical protein